MNPLPEGWQQQSVAAGTHVLVLVDTALQHELGRKLSRTPGGALSLLPSIEAEAQALGAWLLQADDARACGIDGIARGVNWLVSRIPLSQAYAHLQPWVVGPLADDTSRGYMRLADSRTLRALMAAWTPAQRDAFCAPWQAWCYADRDGQGALLDMPASDPAQHNSTASPELSEAQYRQLLDASVPDQLLHELKGRVALHASLKSQEVRHHMAGLLLEYARSVGYSEACDQMTLLAWALHAGTEECRFLAQQPAVQQRLTGEILWNHLNEGQAQT